MTEYNVSESIGTVEVMLAANGTSDFNYTVNLTVYDLTTGECACVRACVCVRARVCVHVFTYTCVFVCY